MINGSFLLLSKVTLEWTTPNGEELISKMARVSNPANENNIETAPRLIRYLIKNHHWSPFEMVNLCVKIETTRDIGRQILRHRSFSFQEFSQRYAEVQDFILHEDPRLQDAKNRQNSISVDNEYLKNWWLGVQNELLTKAELLYRKALEKGIAKELARKLLPEGLTNSTMYMNGSLRSWVHYVQLRGANGTQKEHMEIANQIKEILKQHYPNVMEALIDPTSSQS